MWSQKLTHISLNSVVKQIESLLHIQRIDVWTFFFLPPVPNSSSSVYLLAARNRLTGDPLSHLQVDALAARMGVLRPAYVTFVQLQLTSLDVCILFIFSFYYFSNTYESILQDTIAYVEKEAKNTIYGNVTRFSSLSFKVCFLIFITIIFITSLQHPEGFCVYYQGVPLCKIKNKRYLEKHAMCTGDLLYQVCINRFFTFCESHSLNHTAESCHWHVLWWHHRWLHWTILTSH